MMHAKTMAMYANKTLLLPTRHSPLLQSLEGACDRLELIKAVLYAARQSKINALSYTMRQANRL